MLLKVLHKRLALHITRIFIVACLLIPALCFNACATDIHLKDALAQVYFSPHGGCTNAIVREINHASSEILIQAYFLTSGPIIDALVEAHKSGVHVEMILDRANRFSPYSLVSNAMSAGIPAYIDTQHAIAHNKVLVIDKETVVTGSFNFTNSAEERNSENLLVIKSKELAELYINNWLLHREHSKGY